MAEVYKAYHASLDRYVAIKLLHPFLADDAEFKERFEREAQNIAKLRHPHIVQVFDFEYDEAGESYYMVMELIEGPTLKDVLFELATNGRRMEIDQAVRITREAASALSYAHKHNMIHRDVKPANLMIESPDGRVVLTDFGIAKIVNSAQFTASGGMIGTPAYMSPEQGMGESGDERSDLYSLGVILYQMLTGQLPYDAETPLAIILKHLNEPLPQLRKINPDAPEWLERIVQTAMAKDLGDRFNNADEMIAALDAGSAGEVTPVRVSSRGEYETIQLPQTSRLGKTAGLPEATQTGTIAAVTVSSGPNWFSIITVLVIVLGVILMIGIVLGQGGNGPLAGFFATKTPQDVAVQPSETPTNTPTATSTDTPTATATSTPTATSTDTPSPTATDTPTATPTDTPTSTPTDTPTATATDTPTATFTNTPSPTDTPSPTPTDTPTPTPTYTLTPTPTDTPSPTPTDTPTPTPTIDRTATAEFFLAETAAVQTATVQAQIDFFATQRAITPTPNIQRILETCDLAYTILSPEDVQIPPNPNFNNPRLVAANTKWTLELEILNTSTCDWPPDLIFLSFVENAETDISEFDDTCSAGRIFTDVNLTDPQRENIRIEEAVKQGKSITLTLDAIAGERFGCYFGTWELRIPDYDLFIGEPFVISYRAFGGG